MNTNSNNHWALDTPFTQGLHENNNEIEASLCILRNKLTNYKDVDPSFEQDFEQDKVIDARIKSADEVVSKVINFHANYQILGTRLYSKNIQKWKGHVISVEGDTFKAKLNDLIEKGTHEIGEFELAEVSQEDRSLVKNGAAFYWSLGYSLRGGQVTKESVIRFQRILIWDQEDYDEAEDRAEDLYNSISWE